MRGKYRPGRDRPGFNLEETRNIEMFNVSIDLPVYALLKLRSDRGGRCLDILVFATVGARGGKAIEY